MEDLLAGSFARSHSINSLSSSDTDSDAGDLTGVCMIFMMRAHWLRASKGCLRVQHCCVGQMQGEMPTGYCVCLMP